MKKCSQCGEIKPLDLFPNWSRGKNGKRPYCKECKKAYNRDYFRRDYVKERRNAYDRSHYSPEKERERRERLTQQDPSRWARKNANRRSAENAVISNLTKEDWSDILSYFGNSCAYCGTTKELQQDHVIPVTKGGDYTKSNVIPACRSCNASKQNKDLVTWYRTKSSWSADKESYIISRPF